MNFIEKFRDALVNIKEEDDYTEWDVVKEEEPETARQSKQRTSINDFHYEADNIKQIKPDVASEIVLAQLKTINDAPDVVNNLRVNRVCIVNLEGVDVDTAQRIADFLGGASFAMNGSIERINESIFVMAPLGTSIKDLLKQGDKASSGIFSWVSKASGYRH